ncbi:MAG TPA: hypothetical protein VGO00_13645, partial [Kofleriaceae bacterium]|nr:hypothetical protein [Kofleriaceae bacterium]
DDAADDADDEDDPTIALVRKQCTRQTCNLLLSVLDPDPSSGIAHVTASVRSKPTSCAAKKHGKKKPNCASTRKLKVRAGGGEAYTVTITKLKRGKNTVTVTATDNADNSATRDFKIKLR